MEKTVSMASMDDALEKQVQPLSEREVLEVSGGANSRQIFLKSPTAPGGPAGAKPSRQSIFR
ncbi:hypothetical protein [Achromobacter marplatensis]|uniref:hypothetical protein n=1 Tax=Achromobacter marplatensis TaxID=470868 RepID=UPI0039F6A227